MSKLVNELLFSGRDNTFAIKYKVNGSRRDFSTVTKVEFTLNATTVDSVANSSYFDLTGGVGEIIFKMGSAGFLSGDSGVATIVIYDAGNPNGVVFSSSKGPTKINVTVIDL